MKRIQRDELDFGDDYFEDTNLNYSFSHNKDFSKRPITDYIFADANYYAFKTWKDCFPDNMVNLRSLIFNPSWYEFFNMVEKKPYYREIEKILSDYLDKGKDTILPYAELVFNSLNVLSPKNIKVVFIGQDPYPDVIKIGNKYIPQAMGFSFSVPKNFPKPPSLNNIYENLVEFGHIHKIPESGCLAPWILQGCFMINAAFTTFYGRKNSHRTIWRNFTIDLLSYINQICKNLVFLVWGKDAHMLCLDINPQSHMIITSSHPSPLSYDKVLHGYVYGESKFPGERTRAIYQPFKSVDHFGRMNKYLTSVGKSEIFLDILDVSI